MKLADRAETDRRMREALAAIKATAGVEWVRCDLDSGRVEFTLEQVEALAARLRASSRLVEYLAEGDHEPDTKEHNSRCGSWCLRCAADAAIGNTEASR